jgi:ATP-dependent RNA helicase DeaD
MLKWFDLGNKGLSFMMKNLKFEELNLSKEILKAIKDIGFEETFPIQTEAIPLMLSGRDIVGQAMTGTGKTAAFGIPLIEKIDPLNRVVQALVLCPTRELAIQISVEVNKFLKYKKYVSALPVYGGQPIERQIRTLKNGVQIIIGTPGRLLDHINRKTLDLRNVKIVVLDEADQMLDMGFRDDIEMILQETPRERQTVLFSATMPTEILNLAKKYQINPNNIKISHGKITVPTVEQVYFEVDSNKKKIELLSCLIDINNPRSSIVFCNTKRKVDDVVYRLSSRGYAVDGIHGDISQPKRDRIMAKFRKGDADILVATDVAARGIDVPHVEAVFNFDIPQDEESYVHRIGRTGRAGRGGKAFSFVTQRELSDFKAIKRYIQANIELQQIPLPDQIEVLNNNKILSEVKKILQEGNLEKYTSKVQQFVAKEYTSLDVAAALLKIVYNNNAKKNETNLHNQEQNNFYREHRFGRRKSFKASSGLRY